MNDIKKYLVLGWDDQTSIPDELDCAAEIEAYSHQGAVETWAHEYDDYQVTDGDEFEAAVKEKGGDDDSWETYKVLCSVTHTYKASKK